MAGSAGGSRSDPSWLHNLKANDIVTVEVAGTKFQARARDTADRTQRARLWGAHVDALPEFAGYHEQTGRLIPMVTLERLS